MSIYEIGYTVKAIASDTAQWKVCARRFGSTDFAAAFDIDQLTTGCLRLSDGRPRFNFAHALHDGLRWRLVLTIAERP